MRPAISFELTSNLLIFQFRLFHAAFQRVMQDLRMSRSLLALALLLPTSGLLTSDGKGLSLAATFCARLPILTGGIPYRPRPPPAIPPFVGTFGTSPSLSRPTASLPFRLNCRTEPLSCPGTATLRPFLPPCVASPGCALASVRFHRLHSAGKRVSVEAFNTSIHRRSPASSRLPSQPYKKTFLRHP